jgi:DNA-binding NtrC family response regulator
VQRGAFSTLTRPLSDEEVLLAVRRALEHHELESENRRLRGALAEAAALGGLVSRDERMARVFQTLEAVADSRATLLLTGESGTGKTLLARGVHERSGRSRGPFVTVHCGALPPALLESELFGHAKGAFTGALSEREGKFEAAHQGTIFLDEIGTAPLELQVKLLRLVEEGRFERVGETRTREADVRVIAATNVDLREAVARGSFRQDLYWRLEVVRIEIPPLRQRPADVPLLAQRFLERYSALHRRPITGFETQALQRLCAHSWPGNVRELEHTIERAVLLAHTPMIAPGDLWPAPEPEANALPDPALQPLGPLEPAVEAFERAYLARALAEHGGRRAATARALDINRTTLFNKMRKYDLFTGEVA